MRRAGVLASLLVSLVLVAPTVQAQIETNVLLLSLVVNGVDTGKVEEITKKSQMLYASLAVLRILGIRHRSLAKLQQSAVQGLIPFSAVPGMHWQLDGSTQTLRLTIPPHLLSETFLRGNTLHHLRPLQSGLGATVNYQLAGYLGSGPGENVGAGQFDMRVFSPFGVVNSSFLGYTRSAGFASNQPQWIRLDSAYTFINAKTLTRYRVGDFINGGLSWTRPVRMGGIQISSDFSIQPNLITFPLPAFSGSVAVPSTLNLLVNGQRVVSQNVPAGPFQITQIPVVTGAGSLVSTITNALGQQQNISTPFYASSRLLRPSLQSYSLDLGFVRQEYGVLSNDYGTLAESATYRRGITNRFTLTAHESATQNLALAGVGFDANLMNFAILNAAVSGSVSSGRTGTLFSVGIERNTNVWSAGVSAVLASPSYQDIASVYNDPVPTQQISANMGFSLGAMGSLGVAYTSIRQPAAKATNYSTSNNVPLPVFAGQDLKILSLSYTGQIGPVAFYATGYDSLPVQQSQGSTGFMVGITVPLGRRSMASASGGDSNGAATTQVEASQNTESPGQWGYQVYANTGSVDQQFAKLSYRGSWAVLDTGISRVGQQVTGQVGMRGAFSLMDGAVFPSNTVRDSFAVVDTHGFANVSVYNENRLVGKTGSDGLLLVPNLLAFNVNHISIAPDDVPMNATIPFTSRTVRPQYLSGVNVSFPIHVTHGALLKLVLPDGKPVPLGSVAILQSTHERFPVGFGGKTYVTGLKKRNHVEILSAHNQSCTVRFPYRNKNGNIPTIGPLICR